MPDTFVFRRIPNTCLPQIEVSEEIYESVERRRWFPFLVAVTFAKALNVATPPLKVEQPLGRQRARSGGDLGSGLGEQVKVWVGSVGKDLGK